jgi:hypothetical protein
MKNLLRFALTAALLSLTVTAAVAQMGGHFAPPHVMGFWNPVVGAGAVYVVQPAKGDKTEMQIAIVGKEQVDGKDAYWYEMTFNQGSGPMIMKSLMVLSGPDTHVSRMIMQMPGRPPMEMPMQMMQSHAQPPTDVRNEGEDLGSESITVPAGTFTCEHYRTKNGQGDVLVSQKISPYGLVKSKSNDTSMELTKVVTGAKDQITGTPQPFNPQAFMQQQQQSPNH